MKEEVDKFYHIPLLDSIKQLLGMKLKEHVHFSTVLYVSKHAPRPLCINIVHEVHFNIIHRF